MMNTKVKKNKTNLATNINASLTTVTFLLKGKRNASYKMSKLIVSVLGGNPEDLTQLQIWRDGGDIKQRQKVFEAWQKKE